MAAADDPDDDVCEPPPPSPGPPPASPEPPPPPPSPPPRASPERRSVTGTGRSLVAWWSVLLGCEKRGCIAGVESCTLRKVTGPGITQRGENAKVRCVEIINTLSSGLIFSASCSARLPHHLVFNCPVFVTQQADCQCRP